MSAALGALGFVAAAVMLIAAIGVYGVNRRMLARIAEVDPTYHQHLRMAYFAPLNGLDRELRKGATPEPVLADPAFDALKGQRGRLLAIAGAATVVLALSLVLVPTLQ